MLTAALTAAVATAAADAALELARRSRKDCLEEEAPLILLSVFSNVEV